MAPKIRLNHAICSTEFMAAENSVAIEIEYVKERWCANVERICAEEITLAQATIAHTVDTFEMASRVHSMEIKAICRRICTLVMF